MDVFEERPDTLGNARHRRRRRHTGMAIVTTAAALGLALFGSAGISSAAPLNALPTVPLAAAHTTAHGPTTATHDHEGGHSNTTTSAPTPAPQGSAQPIHVDIEGDAYVPATLTINVGDTVAWHNHDTAPHTVKVNTGPVTFESPTLQHDETFTYTFTRPGTYSYKCPGHPNMTGTVTVRGEGTELLSVPALLGMG